MSNKKNTYIVLHGGKECKPVNPHSDNMWGLTEYLEFESANPTYALTEVMPEGVEFEGSEVSIEQYKFMDLDWMNCQGYYTYEICNYDGIPTRIITAIKPLKAIQPINPTCEGGGVYCMRKYKEHCKLCLKSPPTDAVENKEERVGLAALIEYPVNLIDEPGSSWNCPRQIDTNEEYREGFINGANWQQSQSLERIVGFVLEKVARRQLIYCSKGFDPSNSNKWHVKTSENEDVTFELDVKYLLSLKSDIIKEYNNGK